MDEAIARDVERKSAEFSGRRVEPKKAWDCVVAFVAIRRDVLGDFGDVSRGRDLRLMGQARKSLAVDGLRVIDAIATFFGPYRTEIVDRGRDEWFELTRGWDVQSFKSSLPAIKRMMRRNGFGEARKPAGKPGAALVGRLTCPHCRAKVDDFWDCPFCGLSTCSECVDEERFCRECKSDRERASAEFPGFDAMFAG